MEESTIRKVEAPAPGVYEGISLRDYLAWDAVGRSTVGTAALVSPKQARWELDNPHEETEAMIRGSAVHVAVLEPEVFQASYAAVPNDGRTTEAKNGTADAIASGRVPLKRKEFERVLRMAESVTSHAIVAGSLDSRREVSLVWIDRETGLLCKGRLDALVDELRLAWDLKTSTKVSPEEFARSLYAYRYFVQAGFYDLGCRELGISLDDFMFVVVETNDPNDSIAYRLSDEDWELGRRVARAGLRRWAAAEDAAVYEGQAPRKILDLSIPAWARTQVLARLADLELPS